MGSLTGGPEEKWNQFKEVVTETAKAVADQRKNFIRTSLITTTRLYGHCWTKRERPALIGSTTQTVPHCAKDTGTVKPEPGERFASCKTDGRSRKLKKSSSTPTTTATPRCCTALSRPSMALPEVKQLP